MKPDRGLVMELQKRTCIVLTTNGRFLKMPVPRGGAEVGQEIVLSGPLLHRLKPLLAVASLLVAVLAWLAFDMMIPRAAAYIALDINPSIELGVDGQKEIISARGINREGGELLQKVSVLHEPLKEGLEKIIAGAVEYNYLSPGENNIVLATVTEINDEKVNIPGAEIYEIIYKPISNSKISTQLIVAEADRETLKKARQNGVTPGRYLLREEARKKGITITREEIRNINIRELEKIKHFQTAELIKTNIIQNNGKPGNTIKFEPGDRSDISPPKYQQKEQIGGGEKKEKRDERNQETKRFYPGGRVDDKINQPEETPENNEKQEQEPDAASFPLDQRLQGEQKFSPAVPDTGKENKFTGDHMKDNEASGGEMKMQGGRNRDGRNRYDGSDKV
jgi:hypothetical protein